jgi:hypothetical protein
VAKKLKISPEQRSRLEQKGKAYKAFFRSSNGRVVLADLEKLFYEVDLSASDEHKTSIKVGRHSVVYYIKSQIAGD